MITIELNDHTTEDVKCIQELQAMGFSDEYIQEIYNKSLVPDNNVGNKLTPTGKDTNVLTNADRIRAMSDEELAEFVCEIGKDGWIRWGDAADNLKWLKHPAWEE